MAPGGLVATPALEQVGLTWQPVDGATGYRVYVALNEGLAGEDDPIASVSGTMYLHTNLDPAPTYYYRVSAENQWSEGPLSNEVGVTPLAPAAPAKPTGVAATPGDAQVLVKWDPVDGAKGYRLDWGVAANTYEEPIDVQSPYVHANLTNGTTYYYRVSAHNAGGAGPKSIEVSATPGVAAVGAPQNLTAMPGDEKVTLFWGAVDGASSHTVYWADTSPVTTSSSSITNITGACRGGSCEYEHDSRANGQTYYYRVSAIIDTDEGPLSLEVAAKPEPFLAAPSDLTAEADSTEVTLSWESVAGAGSYELFWDTELNVTVADSSILGIADTEYVHTGLTNGQAYYYRVRAHSVGAASDLSDEVSATPQYRFDSPEKLVTTIDVEDGDRFGQSVAIRGDTVVVGASGDDDGGSSAGAAYVFKHSDTGQWQQTDKLKADDAEAGNEFGISVAISGDYLVVTNEVDQTGAAYVFERTQASEWQWRQVCKLTAGHDAVDYDRFGTSVAISGDTIVVGANGDDDGGNNAGAAYVFQRSDAGECRWQQACKLTAGDDAMDYDRFGTSVAVSGDTIVVGANGDDDGGNNAGAAYVFKHSDTGQWQQTDKLKADDAEAGDEFGISVAIGGDYLAVGVIFGDGDEVDDTGAAYVFERTQASEWQWRQVCKLTAGDDAAAGDYFGQSVAISGDSLAVVTPFADADEVDNTGAAYLFQRSEAGGWQQVRKLTAGDDAETGDYFGHSVAISSSHLAVGAAWKNGNAGACYIF